ncbi:MAG: SMC-Scp complex subunit ScpB [Thermoplasmata archaeon]|nr:SMC-Scp complex subunit ScpB [Thermoplasmata archaeon]
MPAKVDELVLRVEAILFAAGKPLSVKELGDAVNATDHRPVQQALRQLIKTYETRQTALEVRKVGDRFALQLRESFVPTAHSVTPVEMAPRTLKALTLIAYHQPLLQSTLARMIGEAAYEEVGRLRGLGLIHAEPRGATLELRTTRSFAEYFGLASTRPDEIRQFLEKKLGVIPPPPPGATISVVEATQPSAPVVVPALGASTPESRPAPSGTPPPGALGTE